MRPRGGQIDQGISAIVECFRVVGARGYGPLETGKCIAWTLERTQGVAAVVECFGVVGLERDGAIVACHRVFVCARDQFERFGMLAALMLEDAVKVQRVEMACLDIEDAPVERIGFVQLPALMMRNGLSQRVRDAGIF